MGDPLAAILSPRTWPTFVLITARLGGMALFAPVWSLATLPRAARAAIVVLLAILLLPLAPRTALPGSALDLPLPIATELLLGLAIGLAGAIIIQAAGLAGEIVALQMGLSLGPALAPTGEEQPSGIGSLQVYLAILIYLTLGGHLAMLRGLAESLRVVPPGTMPALDGGVETGLLLVRMLFETAVRMAAPAMAALLLANAALAILHRAVPNLNTMLVALPITIGVGLVMLGACLPVVAGVIGRAVDALPSLFEAVVAGSATAMPMPGRP